jgi:hypothetical protein
MRYQATIAIAVIVAGAGLAVYSVSSLPPPKSSRRRPSPNWRHDWLSPWIRLCLSPVANSRRNSDRIGGAALNHPDRRLGGDNLARENCGKPTDDFERQLRVLTYANYFRSWPSKADIVSAGWQVSKVSMPEVAGLRGDQAPTPLSTGKGG